MNHIVGGLRWFAKARHAEKAREEVEVKIKEGGGVAELHVWKKPQRSNESQ